MTRSADQAGRSAPHPLAKRLPHPLAKRLGHVRPGLASTGVLLVAGVPLGALLRGGAGAVGAAAGIALVAASYLASSVVLAWVDWRARRLLLIAALATYVTKFTVLGVVFAALARAGWPGLAPAGVAVITAVVAWSAAQAWWTWHAKLPYVDLDEG